VEMKNYHEYQISKNTWELQTFLKRTQAIVFSVAGNFGSCSS